MATGTVAFGVTMMAVKTESAADFGSSRNRLVLPQLTALPRPARIGPALQTKKARETRSRA